MIKVNDIEITDAEISAEMQYHPAENKRAAKVKAAESLVIGQLLLQRAKAVGIQWPEGQVSPAEEERYIDELISKEVAIPRATAEECQHYFDANPDKFHSSPIVEARHILLAAAPDDLAQRDEMSALAQQLLEQIQSHPNRFDEFVQVHSACPSKSTGGNLGQLSKGQTVPEFEKHLMNAEVGLMPYAVESRYGFHIVLVERKIAGAALPFDQVSEKIKQYLDEKVRRQAISQYIGVLAADAQIEGFQFEFQAA